MQVCKSVLLALLLTPVLALASPVVFVGSDDELNHALVLLDKEEIDGLAVSQRFYLESAKQTKDRIRGLIAGLRGEHGKGVYFYGQPFDNGLAKEILVDEDGSGCTPAYFSGVIYTVPIAHSIRMCGADDQRPSEATIRERLSDIDAKNRSRFLN